MRTQRNDFILRFKRSVDRKMTVQYFNQLTNLSDLNKTRGCKIKINNTYYPL